MDDTISRQAAIDIVEKEVIGDSGFYCGKDRAIERIRDLPSAQRKKGHWIRHISTEFGQKLNDIIECSECRIAFSTENMFRRSFCPNCGADMRD